VKSAVAKTLLSMPDLRYRALAEIWKQPGCSNVQGIAINRVSDQRAENNWCFWWEAAEPVRSADWRGSAEQWAALASIGFGACATLVAAGGALFALYKMLRPGH